MSFLQLVLSLDKTIEGFNSILPIVSFWPISQHIVEIIIKASERPPKVSSNIISGLRPMQNIARRLFNEIICTNPCHLPDVPWSSTGNLQSNHWNDSVPGYQWQVNRNTSAASYYTIKETAQDFEQIKANYLCKVCLHWVKAKISFDHRRHSVWISSARFRIL